jgi:hypothetical protein
MKGTLCLVILMTLALTAFSQKKIHLDLGIGFTSHVIKDDAMSPVRYTGVLPTLAPGLIKEKYGKKLIELRFPMQYSTIHARDHRKYPTMKGPMGRFDIDYIHLRHTNLIKDSTNGTFFIGGSFHTLISFRFMQQLDNSAIIYDYSNSLGIAAAYRRTFTYHRKRLMHYHRVSIPVVSLATRPDYMNAYNVIEPKGNDPVSDAFSRLKLRSFGSFGRVIIRNTLFYPIKSNNMIALTYEWQYYGASFRVPIRSAYHSFLFSLLVHIK